MSFSFHTGSEPFRVLGRLCISLFYLKNNKKITKNFKNIFIF